MRLSRKDRCKQRILVKGFLIHPDAPHGTRTGYANYGCLCRKCKLAGKKYRINHGAEISNLARKFRYSQRIMKDGRWYHPYAPHGKSTGYSYWGCRCKECHTKFKSSRSGE